SRVVFSNNTLEGTMTSGKQVIDLFNGVGESIVDQNVFKITADFSGENLGCSTIIEQKTGISTAERSAKGRQFSVCGNVIDCDSTDVIFVSGAYSLAWEDTDEEQ